MTFHRRVTHAALGVALGVGLLWVGSAPAFADRDYAPGCHDRLNGDRARIDRDARRFGEGSPQVRRDVDRMDRDRDWCRSHHAEWDHKLFDFGIYIHK